MATYSLTRIESVSEVFRQVEAQLAAYRSAAVSTEVFEHDAMRAQGSDPSAMAHYMSVGYSAIETICRAMICAGKTEIRSVLDLPSGAGRVTRHLRAFFPQAKLYVGELDLPSRQFAAKTFAAEVIAPKQDFSDYPSQIFDLIFVGSLFTHFDKELFRRALKWFTLALAPGGLLVLTTHGRRHDEYERTAHHYIPADRWAAVTQSVEQTGFGYVETEKHNGASYGVSWSRPSWLLRLIEEDPSLEIVSFQEAGWDKHQDVLVVQRV